MVNAHTTSLSTGHPQRELYGGINAGSNPALATKTITSQNLIMSDYFLKEADLTRQMFDLDEILAFQLENDVQVMRGEDYQYMCYINGSVYATGLTPMYALSYGIKCFKDEYSR
jgi:hypothetical protein